MSRQELRGDRWPGVTLIILMVIITIIVQIYPESILGVMRRQELRRRQVARGDSAHPSENSSDIP